MEITEIVFDEIRNPESNLLAFVRVVFDDVFLVRDLKIVRGNDGQKLYVCMPGRKITDKCRKCGGKNVLDATWCNWCGVELEYVEPVIGKNGKEKKEFDVCHPISDGFRKLIVERILGEWNQRVRSNELTKGGESAKMMSTG